MHRKVHFTVKKTDNIKSYLYQGDLALFLLLLPLYLHCFVLSFATFNMALDVDLFHLTLTVNVSTRP